MADKEFKEFLRLRKKGYYQIPLYNCYWCKCAWCARKKELQCFRHCYSCMQEKKFKMPDNCNNFLDDNKENREQLRKESGCVSCKYKKFYVKIKEMEKNLT